MRGRKLECFNCFDPMIHVIKKESPNEGTETLSSYISYPRSTLIKKESPNEGTET